MSGRYDENDRTNKREEKDLTGKEIMKKYFSLALLNSHTYDGDTLLARFDMDEFIKLLNTESINTMYELSWLLSSFEYRAKRVYSFTKLLREVAEREDHRLRALNELNRREE